MLRHGLSWLKGDDGEDDAVAELLRRVQEGLLPTDQASALRDLSTRLEHPAAAHAFASLGGFAALASVLESSIGGEREDVEAARGALECAAACLGLEGGAAAAAAAGDRRAAEASASAAVQLARTNGLMAAVLARLDPAHSQARDFYCRCVQKEA